MIEKAKAPRCATRWLLCAALLSAAVLSAPAAAAPATLEGTLETIIEDHTQAARTRHFLKTDKGRIELRFAKRAPALLSGARLRVSGELAGNVMALSDSGSSSLTVTAAAPLPNVSGEQAVAVLLVNFSDDTRQPYTLAQANDVVFNQASAFMRENSYLQTWLTGASFGWYTLPIAKTCVTSDIAAAARQAATAAGVNLSAYSRIVYAFPTNTGCGWSGVGSVGGSTSEAWLNVFDLKTTVHELGHNFGLQHSHSNDCDVTPLGPNCTTQDYGDVADAMGSTSSGHYNAFQKERLGWLASGQQPSVTIAAGNGSYSIGAYEAATAEPKALKVLKSTDPATGIKTWYYLEYRRPVGFDASLSTLYGSNLVSGVLIRTGTDGDRNSSYLLDMTPNTVPTFDMTDAALMPGQVFNDTNAGVMVTIEALGTSSATVGVTLSQVASCVRANPQVVLASTSATVAAGTPVVYTATITNKDSAACGASSFAMQSTLPAGWSASFAIPTLTLTAGTTANTTMTVTSPASAPAGTYTIVARAVNGTAPSSTGSASASYVIGGALSASVTTDKAAYRINERVTMSASVAAGGQPVANASVKFTLAKPNGSTVVLSATTDAAGTALTSYRVSRKDPAGSWQVRGDASLVGSSASATSAFTVQ